MPLTFQKKESLDMDMYASLEISKENDGDMDESMLEHLHDVVYASCQTMEKNTKSYCLKTWRI